MAQDGPPAIYFHPDAIEGEGRDLVGRRSAGQSFLRGFLEHMPGDEVRVVTNHAAAAKAFDTVARDLGETRRVHAKPLRGDHDFTTFGTVFFPAPGFMSATWRRQRFGPERCSLVGITHTVSTRRVIENLHNLMLEPVEPWDAIICTSKAVQSVVARQFELSADYIRQRFGATRVPQPQLPIIPLGIHAADFEQTEADRAAMRQRYEVGDDDCVILTMGRLTSVEKANPAPLMIALEEIARATGKVLHLWMTGWANREDEAKLHRFAAQRLAPSVKVRLLDGRAPDIRRNIWAGADVFTLPVDNIQETFGLVPVEAMAAGLPVVMPDWNGFRDTIVHNETGFLVPTAMTGPGQSFGHRIAGRFADGTDDYLRYLSLVQQQTQIDMRVYVAALTDLITNPDLRARMGAAGQAHVRRTLDWQAVIPQYDALATSLAAQRNAPVTTPGWTDGPLNPIEVDPFDLYAQYPTNQPTPQTVVCHHVAVDLAGLDQLDQVNGRALYGRRNLPNAVTAKIAQAIAEAGEITIADLATQFEQPIDVMTGAALFLAKYDYVILKPHMTK